METQDYVVLISAASAAITAIIAAVFAGLASLRSNEAKANTVETKSQVAEVRQDVKALATGNEERMRTLTADLSEKLDRAAGGDKP